MNLIETLNYYNLGHKTTIPTNEGPFGTDKELWGYISLFYSDYLADLQNKKINIVEIGTMYGASLMLWEKFFTKANVVGIELTPYHKFNVSVEGGEYGIYSEVSFEDYQKNSKRIKFYQQDAYDLDFINKTFKDESIDVLIDDGPHTNFFQKKVTEVYYNKIKKGGVIIVEDVVPSDIGSLLNYYKETCENSEVSHNYTNESREYCTTPGMFNIITIKKLK